MPNIRPVELPSNWSLRAANRCCPAIREANLLKLLRGVHALRSIANHTSAAALRRVTLSMGGPFEDDMNDEFSLTTIWTCRFQRRS